MSTPGAVKITAKVRCLSKQESGEGDDRQVALVFIADYADDRNKEWARWTPSLNLQMTVRGSVADQFETSKDFTLTFTPEETE